MIHQNTIFILGAGASVPYGYPTGEGLRHDICVNFRDRIVSLVKDSADSSEQDVLAAARAAQKFTTTFFNSSTPSIDLFLARNIEYADIGKQAIVTSILAAEENSAFREQIPAENRSQDWYSYLFQKMTEEMIDPESYENCYKNEVTFITFNYDRSLEHFLYESLRNSFSSAPLEKIRGQFNRIRIFHVYGIVDKLPWHGGATKYGEKLSLGTTNVLAGNIKIIHERTIMEDDLRAMKDAIREASQIFILGFGYARENLKMIGIPSLLNGEQQIYGTAFNFTNKEISETRDYLSGYFKTQDPRLVNPRISNVDCRRLLRDWL